MGIEFIRTLEILLNLNVELRKTASLYMLTPALLFTTPKTYGLQNRFRKKYHKSLQ